MAKAPVKSRAARKRTATKIARGAATREQKKAMPKKTSAKKTTPKKTSAKKIPKGRIGALIGGGTLLIGGLSMLRNKPKTFGEKFKKARAKGERTVFDYKGKKYSAVTKDDLKRAGYTNLRDYLNAKNKKKK